MEITHSKGVSYERPVGEGTEVCLEVEAFGVPMIACQGQFYKPGFPYSAIPARHEICKEPYMRRQNVCISRRAHIWRNKTQLFLSKLLFPRSGMLLNGRHKASGDLAVAGMPQSCSIKAGFSRRKKQGIRAGRQEPYIAIKEKMLKPKWRKTICVPSSIWRRYGGKNSVCRRTRGAISEMLWICFMECEDK